MALERQLNEIHGVIVHETYSNYQPHINVRKVVERLIAAVPANQLRGIKTVVLTNSGNLNHNQRRGKTWSRRRKVRLRECLGLYYHKTTQSEAWIEIFVDNILSCWPRALHYVPLLRDIFFAEPLYHEIGHHIHATQRPEYKEREAVADKWSKQLGRPYFKRTYWYLIPLVWIAKVIRHLYRIWKTMRAKN
jgi:hypothetical protein